MLVMSRRVGESIVIDGDIVVTVLELKGQKIRIGVAAPGDVVVDREEVHDQKHPATAPDSHMEAVDV